jgi:hypothetical protein
MRRETKILLTKAIDSLIVSIDSFNSPWDQGRVEAFLIMLDHSFEMLLKAAILHRNGKIRDKGEIHTIGFDTCIRRGLSAPGLQFLIEEQALTLQAINNLRDAAQHHYLDISEDHLYLHAQSGLTLFRDLLDSVFKRNLADYFPERVLPIATKLPTDLITLFKNEITEIKQLLAPGKRQRVQALGRLRSLAIVENAVTGNGLLPSDSALRKVERQIRDGEDIVTVFPGVASIHLTSEGSGASLSIRISKKEGIPVQIVPEGTPGAAVVAVKRVDELGFYNLSFGDLATHVGLTTNKTTAVIWCLKLKNNPDFHKEIVIGKSKFDRYSQRAIAEIKESLKTLSADECWKQWRSHMDSKKLAKHASEMSTLA